MLRRALTDFVIHGAQLLSDARLNFTPQANLGLALRDGPSHGVPDFQLVFVRSRRFDDNCLTGLYFSSCPVAIVYSEFGMAFSSRWPTVGSGRGNSIWNLGCAATL